jgi:hypothetical protein
MHEDYFFEIPVYRRSPNEHYAVMDHEKQKLVVRRMAA